MPRTNTRFGEAYPGQSDAPETAPEPDLLEATRRVWQPYTTRPLTREDAREIVENIVGFFDLLHEWNREERRKRSHNGPQ
jgi:hypothetical protein